MERTHSFIENFIFLFHFCFFSFHYYTFILAYYKKCNFCVSCVLFFSSLVKLTFHHRRLAGPILFHIVQVYYERFYLLLILLEVPKLWTCIRFGVCKVCCH